MTVCKSENGGKRYCIRACLQSLGPVYDHIVVMTTVTACGAAAKHAPVLTANHQHLTHYRRLWQNVFDHRPVERLDQDVSRLHRQISSMEPSNPQTACGDMSSTPSSNCPPKSTKSPSMWRPSSTSTITTDRTKPLPEKPQLNFFSSAEPRKNPSLICREPGHPLDSRSCAL